MPPLTLKSIAPVLFPKHKTFVDAEFTILGVVEGNGNLTGKVGKMQFEINGKPFDNRLRDYSPDTISI